MLIGVQESRVGYFFNVTYQTSVQVGTDYRLNCTSVSNVPLGAAPPNKCERSGFFIPDFACLPCDCIVLSRNIHCEDRLHSSFIQ